MKLSIVIPALNEERWIGDCLQSIVDLHDPWIHEIIVVDNGSTDRTSQIASSFPTVTVLHEPRKGITIARQKGLDAATGDLYAALDADTRVSKNWLERIKQDLKDHPESVCIIGQYRYYGLSRWKLRVINALFVLSRGINTLLRRDPSYARGGNTVYQVEALRHAGGFNTEIPFYGEDLDTAMRMHAQGRVLYDPTMIVYSSARRFNAEGFWKMIFLYKLNAVWQNSLGTPLLHAQEKDWR